MVIPFVYQLILVILANGLNMMCQQALVIQAASTQIADSKPIKSYFVISFLPLHQCMYVCKLLTSPASEGHRV